MGGPLWPLTFACRRGVGRLTQTQIIQADIQEQLQAAFDDRLSPEESKRLAHRQLENLGDVEIADLDIEPLRLETRPIALRAGHAHVGEKLHVHGEGAMSLASIATAAGLV